jgi:serine/threonine-protein kinase
VEYKPPLYGFEYLKLPKFIIYIRSVKMAKFLKLPDNLKSWKINSLVSDNKGNVTYKVSKKDYDGTVVKAQLRHVCVDGDKYNADYANFIEDEAKFLQTVSHSGNSFNYLDIFAENKPAKNKIDLYIVTEDLTSLAEQLKTKSYSEAEVIDFGIKLSEILETLESKNIFHGNLTPENIFVANDDSYKIGGFSDFESKIEDLSFVAPEISRKENADFTTDIYSLGLIMYYMCNNNKLPFEKDGTDKKSALDKRIGGGSISAPENGSEKLKSVIVIACQPNNANRWKNAGNIKNALTSIRQENSENEKAKNNVIVPESTEFDGNVFEEYEYEDFAEETPAETEPENENAEEVEAEPQEDVNSEEQTEQQAVSDDQPEDEKVEEVEPKAVENEPTEEQESKPEPAENKADENTTDESKVAFVPVVNSEDIIENNVFDEYEVNGKASLDRNAETKDYGAFFDDDPLPSVNKAKAVKKEVADEKKDKNENLSYFDDFDENALSDNDTNDIEKSVEQKPEKTKKSKKNALIIVLCVLVILAALGFIAYCVINGVGQSKSNQNQTTESTTEIATTVEPTTAAPTTAAPTTEPTTATTEVNVTPVIGYGYSYAKELLENDGFTVEIGEYRYSDIYDEGYVISQSPDSNVPAEKGSVVTLDISLGAYVEPTEAATKAESSSSQSSSSVAKTRNSYVFSNSDSAYLSSSDVSSLSDSELQIAINEIYARRGRIFEDEDISNYFNSQSWYTPKYSSEEFDKNVEFNSYEQKNLQLLVDERKKR